MKLSQAETQQIIDDAKKRGISGEATISGLIQRGYEPEGIDIPKAKALITVKKEKTSKNPFEEALGDVKDVGRDIGVAADKGVAKMQEIETAEKEKKQGMFSSLFQKFGAGAKFASDTAGAVFKGAAKVALPEKTEVDVGKKFEEGIQWIGDQGIVQEGAALYKDLAAKDPAAARNLEAALNTILLGVDVATAGASGRVAKVATDAAGEAAVVAARAGGTAAKIPAFAASEVSGALTGTSGETIRQAFNAARAGGKELQEFTDALRKKTTPEQLVGRLRESTDTLSAEKTAKFGEMLDTIGDTAVATDEVLPGVLDDFAKVGVKVGEDGQLDFSGSKFRTVPQAQAKLQKAYDEVAALGAEQTVRGVDTSRQALGALLLAGDDASARTANFVITNAINKVRAAGTKVDGYQKALTEFGDDAEFLNEISRALSSGDQATVDTAYRKLATALKTNNEQRRNLLEQLDDMTDGYILSAVAGQQLSEELPRGIFRQIAAGMVGSGVITGGVSTSILPALVFASPRVTGEVLRAAGVAAGKIDDLVGAFKKAREEIETIPKVDGAAAPSKSAGTVKRDNSLTGDDAAVQEASIRKYESDPEGMTQAYLQENGNVVNTDDARKLFADVGYKGYNAAAVHEAASALSKKALEALIKKAPKGSDAFYLAGSSGSGKTTAVRGRLNTELNKAAFVLDGNLSRYETAIEKIHKAEAAGIKPTIVYVYRDPLEAWNNGVISRMLGTGRDAGRVVPVKEFMENLTGSIETVKRLISEGIPTYGFKNNANRTVTDMSMTDIKSLFVPADLQANVVASVENLRRLGKITEEQYKAFMHGVR